MSDNDSSAEFEAKRRKLRKGTRSCWECKRRKTRCLFNSPTDPMCINCGRRRLKCISQEFPEEVSASLVDTDLQIGHRVMRIEALVEQLMQKIGNGETSADGRGTTSKVDSTPNDPGIHTPASIASDSSRLLGMGKATESHTVTGNNYCGFDNISPATNDSAVPNNCENLSKTLHGSLPPRRDIEMIHKACDLSSIGFTKKITISYTDLGDLESLKDLPDIPGADVHPVLIARYILNLAIFVQHLPPDFHEGARLLSEPPRVMSKRLADTAIKLVTTNDALLGSIEGLECIMLESLYQANGGNLRRSWVAVRRAMVVAQMMCLPRAGDRGQFKVLDPKMKIDPQFMWFRIVFYDRHLCLMLGLPQGSLDRSMSSEAMLANDTPLGRLERMHCVLASRILERNEAGPSSHDFAVTQELDTELQRIAKTMPKKWWLAPDLGSVINHDPGRTFWYSAQLSAQLFHYNMLNQIHLPYMLCPSAERKFDYSRITCVNASREVLSRFIMFRALTQTIFSCRNIDFLALMAAMTLLLAHLDSHSHLSSQTGNLLAHQRLSDVAMMEQVQENMEQISRLSGNALSTQGADLLRRLLAIEAEAAEGHTRVAESVTVLQSRGSEMQYPEPDSNSVVRVYIPYFGIIKIAREGVISKEPSESQQSCVASRNQNKLQVVDRPSTTDAQNEVAQPSSKYAGFNEAHDAQFTGAIGANYDSAQGFSVPTVPLQPVPNGAYTETQVQFGELQAAEFTSNNGAAVSFPLQFPTGTISSDTLFPQQREYPVLTAGVEDWAFQGVDMAFFDSLMRGSRDDDRDDAC